jgi:hypothetical protein
MKLFLASLVTATLLAGCASTPTVTTDHDPAVNFSDFHSYYWLKQPDLSMNPLAVQRIVAGIDGELAAKGWSKGTAETASVAVVANVATHEQQDLDTMYTGMGGWGYGGWGYGMGMGTATTRVVTYTIGTLIVDMFDAKTKRAIWRGTAQGTVSEQPEKNTAALNTALDKMFATFPPGSAPPAK